MKRIVDTCLTLILLCTCAYNGHAQTRTPVTNQPSTMQAHSSGKMNQQWADSLNAIFDSDQEARRKYLDVVNTDPDSAKLKAAIKALDLADEKNQQYICHFIDQHGWVGPEEVGEKGAGTLFLVIQHAPLAIQEKYIPLLRDAVKQQKARSEDLALMEDRISVRKYGYQIYGSQVRTVDGKTELFPIKEEKEVNKRRAAVGLQPIEEYVKHFNMSYTPPK